MQTSDNTAMIIKWAVRIGIIVFDDKKIISSLKLREIKGNAKSKERKTHAVTISCSKNNFLLLCIN